MATTNDLNILLKITITSSVAFYYKKQITTDLKTVHQWDSQMRNTAPNFMFLWNNYVVH